MLLTSFDISQFSSEALGEMEGSSEGSHIFPGMVLLLLQVCAVDDRCPGRKGWKLRAQCHCSLKLGLCLLVFRDLPAPTSMGTFAGVADMDQT